MSNMKHRFFILCLVTLISAMYTTTTQAENMQPAIHDVDIMVKIDATGTAHISEKWNVVAAEGTEWYLVMSALREGMIVKDVSVTDETEKKYIVDTGDWDTDRSLEEKAGHCGILAKDAHHYEVCWGLGNYGHHVYLVNYVLTNLVQSLHDKDAFNHKFLSDKLSSNVEHAKVTIILDSMSCRNVQILKSNTQIWAFGSNKCYIQIRDGKIICNTINPLDTDESIIIMAGFNKGLFHPTISQDRDFKEMRDNALNNDSAGSDDEVNDSFVALLLVSFFIFVVIVIISVVIIDERKKKKAVFGTIGKIKGWCHDIPFSGHLFAANYVLHAGQENKANALEGAFMLKWIQKKIISVRTGDNKNDIEIVFDHQENESLITNESEKLLFDILKTASGDDLILQKDELGHYMEKSTGFKAMKEWNQAAIKEGEQELISAGLASYKSHHQTQYHNLIFNEKGMDAACKMIEYKNYLKEHTNADEREISDTALLDNQLIFATLFGIADKVLKNFEKIYPNYCSNMTDNSVVLNNNFLIYYLFMTHFQNNFSGTQISNLSGDGGVSSFGGGGFSGGGGGGCR